MKRNLYDFLLGNNSWGKIHNFGGSFWVLKLWEIGFKFREEGILKEWDRIKSLQIRYFNPLEE